MWMSSDCVAFKGALRHILEADREECRVYLETHAFRVEKQLLHKMNHRVSGRKMGWANSLYKYDHSLRDKDGNRVRTREVMNEGSKIPAPQLFPVSKLNEKIKADRLCRALGAYFSV